MFSIRRYEDLYLMYKKAVASFWAVEEVDLSADMRDWDRLTGMSCTRHLLVKRAPKSIAQGLMHLQAFSPNSNGLCASQAQVTLLPCRPASTAVCVPFCLDLTCCLTAA